MLKSAVTIHRFDGVQAEVIPEPPNSQSYDLAILRLDDMGALVDQEELARSRRPLQTPGKTPTARS